MADLTIPKGDYGYDIIFTIQDADGNAYDLTGYTIKFKVWKSGSSGTLFINGACTIVKAVSGICKYLIVKGDFKAVDIYKFELELTKSGVVESIVSKELKVVESG